MKSQKGLQSSNQKNRNKNNNDMTLNLANMNKTQVKYDSTFTSNQPSKTQRKKVISQKNINERNKYKTSTIQNLKKSSKTSTSNCGIDSKLSPRNYIKPLYYLLYSQIRPVNKQFLGFRDERYYLYYEYPLNSTDRIRNKEEKKENNYSKTEACNTTRALRNKRNQINNTMDSTEIKNLSANLIQACFKGYLARKMLYNSLSPYSKYRKDINDDKSINSKMNSDRSNGNKNYILRNKNKKIHNKRNTIFEADNEIINDKKLYNSKAVKKLKSINSDYSSRIEYNNKNNEIEKNEDFMISGYYKNHFNLFKNSKNGDPFDNETFNKEKELYERKIKELIEENKKIKGLNIEFQQNEIKYNNILQENEILNNKIIELTKENNTIKQENEKLNNEKNGDDSKSKLKEMLEENYRIKNENEAYKQQLILIYNQSTEKIKELYDENNETINKLKEENNKMKQKLEEYEQNEIKYNNLQEEKEKLNVMNIEFNNKLNTLIEENNRLKEKNKELELNENNYKEANIQLKELLEENNKMKEKYKNFEGKEDTFMSLEEENKKMNLINNEVINKNKELQNKLNEMKKRLKRIEKGEDVNDDEDDDNNSILDDNYELNRQLYLDRIRDRKFISPEERKLKEGRLKNLFKKKVVEMKEHLHSRFMKFYYNGIFVQMQAKINDKEPNKVVRSKRFSNLINKFNRNSSTEEDIKRNQTLLANKRINSGVIDFSSPLKKATTILEKCDEE
jgi:hypothetical protein